MTVQAKQNHERAGHLVQGLQTAMCVGMVCIIGSVWQTTTVRRNVAMPAAAEKICPNTAPAAGLMRLPGVGKVRATAIVAGRTERPYRSADDLQRVHGIGPKTVEKIKPFLRFESRSQNNVIPAQAGIQ